MNELIRKAKEIVKTLCESHLRQRPDTIWDGYIGQMEQIENALNQAEENEKELNDLQDFMAIILSKSYWSNRFSWIKECKTCEEYNGIFIEKTPNRLDETEFVLIKKVVEKYGKDI